MLWDLQHASIRAGAEKVLFPANREVAVAPAAKRYAALTASVLRLMATNDEEDGALGCGAGGVGSPWTVSEVQNAFACT